MVLELRKIMVESKRCTGRYDGSVRLDYLSHLFRCLSAVRLHNNLIAKAAIRCQKIQQPTELVCFITCRDSKRNRILSLFLLCCINENTPFDMQYLCYTIEKRFNHTDNSLSFRCAKTDPGNNESNIGIA